MEKVYFILGRSRVGRPFVAGLPTREFGVLIVMFRMKIENNITTLFRLAAICWATVLVLSAGELPPEIVADLERQSKALARFHIEYNESQKGPDLPEYYGGSSAYVAYFDDNRFYLRSDLHYKQGNQHTVNEYAFDGKYFYSGANNNGMLVKYLAGDETDPQRFDSVYIHYFEDAGFYVPQLIKEVGTEPSISPLILRHLTKGRLVSLDKDGGEVRVTVNIPDPQVIQSRAINLEKERKKLLKLRNGPNYAEERIADLLRMQAEPPERTVVFHLDPAHDHRVMAREEFTAKGQLILRSVANNWRRFEKPGIWLPQTCVVSYHSSRFMLKDFSPEPRLTVTYKVLSVDFRPHDEVVFDLTKSYVRPGTFVFDRSVAAARGHPDHAVVYNVSADGSLLRGSAARVSAEMGKGSRRWLIFLLAILSIYPALRLIRWLRHIGRGRP
jgi:hypothetical protein